MSFYSYQDFLESSSTIGFCQDLIENHISSREFATAIDADLYDRRMNSTINEYVQKLFSSTGIEIENIVAANNKIPSNFFRRLNVQRNMYSLGNGITFPDKSTKDKLGPKFDNILQRAGYYSLIHGVSFVYWGGNAAYVFPLTEFAPLWDEKSGALMAGVRFWRSNPDKPMYATLYEQDGYIEMVTSDGGEDLRVYQEKRSYGTKVLKNAVGDTEVVGEVVYSSLPIVPLYGSSLKQSTLVGMKPSIDSYDLIRSGFANDLTDCAQIYWIIKNAGGMTNKDLDALRTRMLLTHMITVDADDGAEVEAHQQDIPFQARSAYLDRIRKEIYSDFGALDVDSISSAAVTATQINAAYQPLDENADDYEYQIIECVQQLLSLAGVTGDAATPIFKRNRVANENEAVQTVILEAPYLDQRTILKKLPNISDDEIDDILDSKESEDTSKYSATSTVPTPTITTAAQEEPVNVEEPEEV